MWKKIKSIDYMHWLCLCLILGSAALGVFCYRFSFLRLFEGLNDFGRIIAYTFADLVDLADMLPFRQTVNDFSVVNLQNELGLDITEISRKLTEVWSHVFVGENILSYLTFLLYYLVQIIYYASILLIVSILFAIPIILTWDDVNNDYNRDSKPLRLFKRFVVKPFRCAAAWCRDFWDFFRYSYWWRIFLALWLLYFGVYTVILEFFAYYFYILNFFDLTTIGRQLLKLLSDVILTYTVLPWFCWAALALWLFDKWRVRRGTDKLYHMDARNKGLLKEMPMCNYIVAMPRSGKDMMMNDMAITFGALDRQTNLEILNENMKRFPRFPWILFELEIKDRIHDGTVRHWASARSWINARYLQYAFTIDPALIWDYDVDREATEFNDGLKIITLRAALEEYVQAYFSYSLASSYLVSNAPVRDDFVMEDFGNFPLFDTDYLNRDPEELYVNNKYSHILDWDMVRLGEKVKKDNPNIGAFEFGVLVLTEIDKERKNADQLRETKIKDAECNQKNDLFNLWMKMGGHSAMLGNRCLLHVLTNAQRPSSWGADGHELCAIMHIEKHKGNANTLPLFWVEEGIISKYLSWWDSVWNESRNKRGDNRLLTWLGQGLASILYGYLTRRMNRFGYYQQKILCETGTLDDQKNVEKKRYFVLFRKAYAERYASDYFRAFSELQTEKSAVGIGDLPTYRDKYPSFYQLKKQNSHLNKELFKHYKVEETEKLDPLTYTDENLNPDAEEYARFNKK